ncbi:MAG: hypothetical protein LV481_08100 [Methylacidiphilales bacterium]|nr:hypothetical protein [Candidatus Methylacidiphilales bacterium]
MNLARLLFLGFLFFAAPLLSHAQTNTTDNSTTAPAAANAPDLAPAQPAPAVSPPGQIVSPAGTVSPPGEIEDIRPPFFFLHSWFWLWVALGVVGALALLVLLWFWFKPEKWLSPKSAYELTLENLEKARALLSVENPMPYAVFISETIRSYLSQRFRTPSTRRTTEEFLRLMESDRDTPLAAYRDLLRDFLRACDLVKFGRYQPDLPELEQVHQRAFTFVTATRPSSTPDDHNRRPT